MGILGRIANLFRANANRALDKLEDPETMTRQALEDMQDGLRKGKMALAQAITEEKKCHAAHLKHVNEAADWRNKAQAAVEQNQDDLAREAIKRARSHDVSAELYRTQHEQQQKAVSKLRLELSALETKIAEVRQKQEMLIARKGRADAIKQVNEALAGIGKHMGAMETFERMESKVEHAEAEAEAAVELAGSDLDNRFDALGADEAVEAELARLKNVGATE